MADLSLARQPWHIQLAVFVLLAVAGGATYYYLYDRPAQEALTASTIELDAIRARIAKGLATARQLDAFKRQVGDLERRLESLQAILPQEKDVADLLRRLQNLATQSNLTIRGFKPEAIATRQLHAEWPIGLDMEGTYHNLGVFLDRVSKLPRIINIGSVTIDGKQQPTPDATIEVSSKATTFVLLQTPAVAATTSEVSPEAALPSPPPSYVYAAEGRRDPFVPAIGRGPVAPATSLVRPPGIAGITVAELSVRGILESQGAWTAIVRAADGRTYTVRAGDRLMDGTIGSITADVVVVLQEVHDPLSIATQREVRKLLRGGEQIQ